MDEEMETDRFWEKEHAEDHAAIGAVHGLLEKAGYAVKSIGMNRY